MLVKTGCSRLGIWLIAFVAIASQAMASGMKPFDPSSVAGRQGNGQKIVLGKLGQAISSCRIYAKPDTHSKVYYDLKAEEYLVVKRFDGDWTKILLQNGEYGYAVKAKIAFLPYQVISAPTGLPGLSPTNLSQVAMADFAGRAVTKKLRGGGFVAEAFGRAGKKLPVSLDKQIRVGSIVDRLEKLQPGDRVYFWSAGKDRVGYAGIYLGSGYFIAPLPGEKTFAAKYLGEKKWLNVLVAARR